MRLNKFVAQASGLSRRAADKAIEEGRVTVNLRRTVLGEEVTDTDTVQLDDIKLKLPDRTTMLLLNKPVGYVCSRDGQGSATIYELLPKEYHNLKTAGRLDKDSSGLVILTDDGVLAQQLTHPSFNKNKVYTIKLNQPLSAAHQKLISTSGVKLTDGNSKLGLKRLDSSKKLWQVTMHEGRNRQIRRTFEQIGLTVIGLSRLTVGEYNLKSIAPGRYKII